MKKIVLMGNPNVGKSVIFSRLTGANVISSNYPGTTVEFTQGRMRIGGGECMLVDAPGTYSLRATNRAEEIAAALVEEADLIIQVVDATTLERNLLLTLELIERGKPLVVALNMWDEAKHTGIEIDLERLRELLGVPVVPTVALTGEGIRELVEAVAQATPPRAHLEMSMEERWMRIGAIAGAVQRVTHRHHTWRERLSDVTIVPSTGIPIGVLVLLSAFAAVWMGGELIRSILLEPIFSLLHPHIASLANTLGPGLVRDLLIGQLFEGEIVWEESMGILTTGIYVPFAIVLPYIITFYTILALLEDSGYLPRLATLADTLFHRLGMHGHAIIPCFLGLGCNVPGVLGTRMLESRRQRFIAATLISVTVPCTAQTAMIFGVLGSRGLHYVILVYFTLIVVFLVLGVLLKHFIPGESPELLLEIPPYRFPGSSTVIRKIWVRVKGFLLDAVPFLILGILFANILYFSGLLSAVGDLFAPFVSGWLGLAPEATAALMMGFLRKDLAVGMLIPLGMTAGQLTVAVIVLTLYFPCIATFAVLLRELGPRDLIITLLIMVITATLVGGAIRPFLTGA